MRVAIIDDDGIVENIIQAEEPFLESSSKVCVILQGGRNAQIGDSFNLNGTFTTPALPPESYKKLRRAAYPPVREQLDILYHAMESGEFSMAQIWFDTIKAVKDRYPKPA